MIATRDAFGESLLKLGEQDSRIVVLDADLSASTKSGLFGKKHPKRFFQMGIAEANMIGTAAGLAFEGYVPFACSFACFLTGRFETIRVSVGYSKANVKLVGTHSGLGVGPDGATQMAIEDISLMRCVPGMTILQPCDSISTHWAVEQALQIDGPVYLRLTRQKLPVLYPQGEKFSFNEPKIVRRGKGEFALIGTGAGVAEILNACEQLKALDDPWILDMPVLKPFPKKAFQEMLGQWRRVVTVEDHSVIGGLGDCVAEAISEVGSSTRLLKLGIQDRFGESGSAEELYQEFGFSAKKIVQKLTSSL